MKKKQSRSSSTDSIVSGIEGIKSLPLKIVVTFIKFCLIDVFGYGIIIPLIGCYSTGCLVHQFGIDVGLEIVLTVSLTMIAMFLALYLCSEQSYWKCLFRFDEFCQTVLWIRDMINTVVILVCAYGLAVTVQEMVKDKSMKSNYLSEGIPYVFFKYTPQLLRIDEQLVLQAIGLQLPHINVDSKTKSLIDSGSEENQRYEHAACLMLLFGMLSTSVAKTIYFNTLFTYLRAMSTFISLHPTFENDESSISMNSGNGSFNARNSFTETR